MTKRELFFDPHVERRLKKLKKQDPQLYKNIQHKIKQLLEATDPYDSDYITGRPHSLKGNLAGWFAIRVNKKDRIIYRLNTNKLEIIQVDGHYTDQ